MPAAATAAAATSAAETKGAPAIPTNSTTIKQQQPRGHCSETIRIVAARPAAATAAAIEACLPGALEEGLKLRARREMQLTPLIVQQPHPY